MRAYGRGFEEFYLRGRNETGITFIKSSPAAVTSGGDGTLTLRYEDPETARPASLETDMVVLSCAMIPSEGTPALAEALKIDVDRDGFFSVPDPLTDPVASTREGVFLCGCASGPKDIPDSVAQGAAAAANILSLVDRGSVTIEPITSEVEETTCGGCRSRRSRTCSWPRATASRLDT